MPESLIPLPDKPKTPPTWTEVAMALVTEIPVIGVLLLIAQLASKGQATAIEGMMTLALRYVGKSWPKPVQVGAVAGFVGLISLSHLMACANPADLYQVEQEACLAYERHRLEAGVETRAQANVNATACRNAVKAQYGRLDASGE